MVMTRAILVGAVFAACASSDAVWAHAHLHKVDPAAGSKGPSPHAVTLTFSEGVVPRFSSITLQDAAGKPAAPGPAQSGTNTATLVLPVPGTLAPGEYTVVWKAVSVDSHRTQGKFSFTVAP